MAGAIETLKDAWKVEPVILGSSPCAGWVLQREGALKAVCQIKEIDKLHDPLIVSLSQIGQLNSIKRLLGVECFLVVKSDKGLMAWNCELADCERLQHTDDGRELMAFVPISAFKFVRANA